MANFICPFSKKVCNPSCEHWEFEKVTTNKRLMGVIPVNISVRDLLSSDILLNNVPVFIGLLVREYQRHYELYHPEKTSTPRGKCKKIEKMHQENLTTSKDL